MNKLIALLLALPASGSLAVTQPLTLTVKTPAQGDAYTHHLTWQHSETSSMEYLDEDGVPQQTAPGPATTSKGHSTNTLTALSTNAGHVDKARCQFGKIQGTKTTTIPDPDSGAEDREVENWDRPALSEKSFTLTKSPREWTVTADENTALSTETADLVLGFHLLAEDPPADLFPPQSPATTLFSSGAKYTPGSPVKLTRERIAPFLEETDEFKTTPESKTTGTLTLKEITTDGKAIFEITVHADAIHPHDFDGDLKKISKLNLEATISFDTRSGWLRSAEIKSTTTSTYLNGVQGIVWNQTDKTTTHSKSAYTLNLKDS